MPHPSLPVSVIEAGKVLDSLTALSIQLSCHCDVTPETLVLEARRVKEACEAIDDAVAALKRLLAIAEAAEGNDAAKRGD